MRINNFYRFLLRVSAILCFFALPVAGQTPQFVPNYDESKVGAFTLPDPLKMNDGRKVTNARLWPERRQEIIKLYSGLQLCATCQ